MITEIGERIEVAAVFGRGEKIRPVWFVWNGKKIQVEQITYRWTEREGAETYHRFSVTDGAGLFELSYTAGRLCWELVAVESE